MGLFCTSKLQLLYPKKPSRKLLLHLDSRVYVCALCMGLSAAQRFLVTPKLGEYVGYVWNEDRMTMFIAEIPHSNSCQLHYCQINSELLPIIHCLAWGKWNGGFASIAEMRVAQPSEKPCRVAKEMSNTIWSESIFKVLQGTVLALYTLSPQIYETEGAFHLGSISFQTKLGMFGVEATFGLRQSNLILQAKFAPPSS